jgi:polysaccharide pyruvyl transferase WcaK-like protein
MDPFIRRAARHLCDETYFIARSQPSLDIIRGMGLKGDLGTDTAWMARAAPKAWARQELERRVGWDGRVPLIGVAVVNPFWWPVRADPGRYLLGLRKASRQYHYAGWYFFGDSDKRRVLFRRYLAGIARAVDGLAEKHRAQVVVFGMEAVDLDACLGLQRLLRTPSHVFCSTEYDGHQLASLLQSLTLLVTSRYHARVLSMPAGVPSIAVSIDERLHNLYAESGHVEDYYMAAGDPLLEEKLSAALETLWANREQVSAEIRGMMPCYLDTLAGMGAAFRDFVRASFPQLPLCPEPTDRMGYLAPLGPELQALVEHVGEGS